MANDESLHCEGMHLIITRVVHDIIDLLTRIVRNKFFELFTEVKFSTLFGIHCKKAFFKNRMKSPIFKLISIFVPIGIGCPREFFGHNFRKIAENRLIFCMLIIYKGQNPRE